MPLCVMRFMNMKIKTGPHQIRRRIEKIVAASTTHVSVIESTGRISSQRVRQINTQASSRPLASSAISRSAMR